MGSNQHLGTVLILNDDESLLDQLRGVFAAEGWEVHTYSSVRHILAVEPPEGAACLLADLKIGEYSGLEVFDRLKQLGWDLPTIFLAGQSDVRTAVYAMRCGAADFIPEPFELEELVATVSRVLDQSRQSRTSRDNLSELHRRTALLSPREREIIRLVVSGLLNKQIAEHLRLALVTVKVHRGNAMYKLGARSAAELVRIARAVGLTSAECEVPPLSTPLRRRLGRRSLGRR